jgi:predicted PurR-regulated permease PerM
MTWRQRLLAWLGIVVLAVALVLALKNVLLPFVLGMAVAYMLDPVVDRLERRTGRTAGTFLVLTLFFVFLFGALFLIVPVIGQQAAGLGRVLPRVMRQIENMVTPALQAALDRAGNPDVTKLPELASTAASAMWSAITGVLSGGLVLFDLLSVIVITPIVSFYLLRDWDRIVAHVDDWLPRANAETIREQARTIDSALAAFVRGQALVCLALGLWYAVGLTLIGIDFGVLIGVFIGVIAFIPIVGSLIGAILSTLLALIQFGTWLHVGLVLLLFAVGQFSEAYLLAPQLIGDRVGLHPVWIIFALLAGGAIAGFLGVLLAVPVAAAIGVLTRFALQCYLESRFYREPAKPEESG